MARLQKQNRIIYRYGLESKRLIEDLTKFDSYDTATIGTDEEYEPCSLLHFVDKKTGRSFECKDTEELCIRFNLFSIENRLRIGNEYLKDNAFAYTIKRTTNLSYFKELRPMLNLLEDLGYKEVYPSDALSIERGWIYENEIKTEDLHIIFRINLVQETHSGVIVLKGNISEKEYISLNKALWLDIEKVQKELKYAINYDV